MKQLQLYTIMPLDTAHVDEICADIREQYENGIGCPLFKMTLVPEGTPPVDKAKIMGEQYAVFKSRLDAMNVPNGILVQASIGHGWKLNSPSPFQLLVNMDDGCSPEVVCPYDEGFRDYIYNAMRTLALQHPDFIMIDDDFRLLERAQHRGCGCPLHMKRFNELAGTDLSREDLYDILTADTNKEYADIFVGTQRESLVETAKVMRAGIDSVDPSIPGSFCCVGNNAEFAYENASVLAGKGNPTVIRINNGNYTAGGARWLTSAFQRAAAQIAKLKKYPDTVILAETDTCPQNRYSTGAMQLHSHFTGTVLEGAAGAKHWITRLASYEPESGRAYRKILAKYSGFYSALAEIVPTLTWLGCRIPVNESAEYVFGKAGGCAPDGHDAWSLCVLERMGIPFYFSAENTGVLCLEGDVRMSDDKLMEAFRNPMFIASDSAKQLIERGFGKYIGVDVEEHTGKVPSREFLAEDTVTTIQHNIKRLVPLSDETRELSTVFHTVDNVNFEKLFPGVTAYKNELGGTIFVFCGTPNANYDIVQGIFSFLNCSRKKQLISMLESVDSLPVYYPNDEEVYLRAARTADGGLFVSVFNIGLDPIEKLELVCGEKIQKIYALTPSGDKSEISFSASGNKYVLDCPCNTLEPVILFLQ